jgi:hypothetical protein
VERAVSGPGLRRLHGYIGLISAPSVLFFALTGIVQIFGWHEPHDAYQPAPILARLSAVHKDQVFDASHKHDQPPPADASESAAQSAAAAPAAPDGEDKTSVATLALKWFFCLVAVALSISTLIGTWLGLTQTRRKPVAWTLFIAGWVVPIGLLLLS